MGEEAEGLSCLVTVFVRSACPADACYSFEVLLGDDLRLRPLWQFCGLWRTGQHLLYI